MGGEDKRVGMLERDMQEHTTLTDSLKLIDDGIKLKIQAIEDEEQLNLEKLWSSLDNFRQAATSCTDIEIVCISFTEMAKVYLKVFKDPVSKIKGKGYLRDTIHMCDDLKKMKNIHAEEWYKEATKLYQEIQDEAVKKEESKWEHKRKGFMAELEEEMKLLKSHSNDRNKELVEFLFEKFPPVHRTNEEWKQIAADGEEKGWKKSLMKLVTVYHPDRVNVEKYGGKYHVLCEEICKVLTEKYTSMKGF